MEAETLASQWLTAKRAEIAATAARLEIESQILKAIPAKAEGSVTTLLSNGLKLKTTAKLTYKADIERLSILTSNWPESARPIKTKIEADEAVLKVIRTDRPDLWARIADAITVKPAKVYITIEEVGNV